VHHLHNIIFSIVSSSVGHSITGAWICFFFGNFFARPSSLAISSLCGVPRTYRSRVSVVAKRYKKNNYNKYLMTPIIMILTPPPCFVYSSEDQGFELQEQKWLVLLRIMSLMINDSSTPAAISIHPSFS